MLTEPEAAVAMLRTENPDESILFIRRTVREDDSWSGHWSFPGGRRDPEDRDLLHTALRELQEECGIRLERSQMETALPPVVARRKSGPYVLVAPFVFRIERALPTVLDPREAAAAAWIPRTLLCDPAQHRLRSVPNRPEEMLFSSVDLNDVPPQQAESNLTGNPNAQIRLAGGPGVPLWGFTYRLLTDWLMPAPKNCSRETAGFAAADLVLRFLIAKGLKLKEEWRPAAVEQHIRKVAAVEGPIPVALVLARFGAAGEHVPLVNFLHVRPDYIRVAGLEYEEYLISAHCAGNGR